MSPEDPKPLPSATLDLLRVERGAIFAPEDARSRVLARLAAKLPAPTDPDASGGDGGHGSPATPASSSPGGFGSLARPLSLGLALAVGGVGGAALWSALRPAPDRVIVYVDRPVLAPAPVAAPILTSPPTSASGPPTNPARAAPDPAARNADDGLAAERGLLDVARTAISRGDGENALAATARHERRFPAGALAEEREAMAIQALLLLRRDDDARARGAEFHRRFPGSVLAPAIDAALETIR